MDRAALEHILRAAAAIANEREFVVISSQAVLGQFPDAPDALLASIEADLKNWAYGRMRRAPNYAGFYFSPAYDRSAYPRSTAGQQLSSTEEFIAVARDSPDSDMCRAIIDLDRYLCLVERGFRVEYQGELLVAERSAPLL
jgi:hypothetical protein